MIAVELPSVRGTLVSGLLTLVVLGLGFGTWATLGSIAGAVIARGQVEVESSRLAVQHPIGGRVAELMVEEGQEVAAGEVLLRLDSTESVGDLAAVESRLAALLAEVHRRVALAFRQLAAVDPTAPDVATLEPAFYRPALVAAEAGEWQQWLAGYVASLADDPRPAALRRASR